MIAPVIGTQTASAATRMHIDTRTLPESRRVELVRAAFSSKLFQVAIEPLQDAPFWADMTLQIFPGLRIVNGALSAGVIRGPDIVQEGSDDLLLTMPDDGLVRISHRGQDFALWRGDAHIGWCAEPMTFKPMTRDGACLRIPLAALKPLVPDIEDKIGAALAPGNEAIILIRAYLDALKAADPDPATVPILVSHIHDLVALAVGTSRDGRAAAQNGLHAARFAAIRSFVSHNIRRPDLSIRHVAALHGFSERYVQRLFEARGTTFSAFVLRQRMCRAYALLTDPRFAAVAIGVISYEAGFMDLAQFSRAFRKHFGFTPSDARRRGRAGDQRL